MALTDAQKLKMRLLLRITAEQLDEAIADKGLTATDEAEIAVILTAASSVEASSNLIQVDGVTIDPAAQRRILSERLSDLLELQDADPNTVYIGRG